jgi:hypothetical protein
METGLPVLRSTNYLTADLALTRPIADEPPMSDADAENTRWMQEMRLENKCYNAFRLTLYKILQNGSGNTRRELAEMVNSFVLNGNGEYSEVSETLLKRIHELMDPWVEFVEYSDEIAAELHRIDYGFGACLDDKAAEPFCKYPTSDAAAGVGPMPMVTTDTQVPLKGVLLLPSKNRIGSAATDNQVGYFARLVDEILRYSPIRAFLLGSGTGNRSKEAVQTLAATISSSEFELSSHDIILRQSSLSPISTETRGEDYFADIPENVERSVSQVAVNRPIPFELADTETAYTVALRALGIKPEERRRMRAAEVEEDIIRPVREDDGPPNTPDEADMPLRELSPEKGKKLDAVSGSEINSTWKRMFSRGAFNEYSFPGDTPRQTFYCIISIIHDIEKTGSGQEVEEIKQKLIEAYSKWMNDAVARDKIRSLKPALLKGSTAKTPDKWKEVIADEDYVCSQIDLWVLCDFLKLPVVLFTANSLFGIYPVVKRAKGGADAGDAGDAEEAPRDAETELEKSVKHADSKSGVKWLVLYFAENMANKEYHFLRIPGKGAKIEYHKISPGTTLSFMRDPGTQTVKEDTKTLLDKTRMGRSSNTSEFRRNAIPLGDFLKSV